MAPVLEVRDELWEAVEPMIPPVRVPAPAGAGPGGVQRDRLRAVTGIAWGHLPRELGCSGVTAWRRLQADGYKVTAPQLPETSLADDVARVRHVLTRQAARPFSRGTPTEARSSPLSAPTHRTSSASSTSRPSGSTRVSRSARCYSRVLRPRRWRMSMSIRRGDMERYRTPPLLQRGIRPSVKPVLEAAGGSRP